MPSDPGPPGGNPGGKGFAAQSDPDAETVRQAQSGDARSFELLVRKHQDSIFGLVVRLVEEAAVAEELTQDTFVRAWRGLHQFRGESRFSTWLYRIAVNLCHDHRGSRGARQRRSEISLAAPEQSSLPLVSGAPGPDQELEERETARAFQQALAELDPVHRAAFLLRHQEGLSPAEIAAALGISEVNARVRVHRAREMILQTLRRMGHQV
jgi:RNA polymerase sigma-70 factor, ECF subfamily